MKPAVRLVEQGRDEGPHSPPDAPERGRRRGRILCVDNRASCNLAALLLGRAGYEAVHVNSLPRSRQRISEEPFDLLLINHELLRGAGQELCERLRAVAAATPVLFYSTVTYPFSRRPADQDGTEGVPVPVTEVALAVARALGGEVRRGRAE